MKEIDKNIPYSLMAKCLHWLIAITIITQITIGIIITRLPQSSAIRTLFSIHKSLGLTLPLLGITFVLWRLCHKGSNLSTTMPTWQRISAKIVQYALFGLIIIVPFSGWLMSTAAGYPPSFWGLLIVKAPIPINATLAAIMSEIHTTLAQIMFVLIVIHTLAALKHAFIDGDGTLKKMWF